MHALQEIASVKGWKVMLSGAVMKYVGNTKPMCCMRKHVSKTLESFSEEALEQMQDASWRMVLGGKFLASRIGQQDAFHALGVQWEPLLLSAHLV